MDFLMALTQPTGLWENFLFGMESAVGNYVVALVLITLIIKFCLIPFDIFNKYISKKNTRKQSVLQPELAKIKKRYTDPQLQNQKTMELYKRENYSIVGTCVGMLVYMAITLVIFITLLGALNNVSAYKIASEYETLQTTYNQVLIDENYEALGEDEKAEVTAAAASATIAKYGEIKESFIWIKNIWRPDTSASVTLSYADFTKTAATYLEKDEEGNFLITEEKYNQIMSPIQESEEYSGWNGYFLLSIIAVLLTFGSTKITNLATLWISKKKHREYVKPLDQNKMLTFILPITMGIFTLLYTSAFGIYIVAGSVFTFVTGPLTTIIVDELDYKAQIKEQNKNLVAYDRKKGER